MNVFNKVRGKCASAVVAAIAVGSALAPSAAVAHGSVDYTIVEYHYVKLGMYTYTAPYNRHVYYCDGDYEFIPGPGGSVGLAYTATIDGVNC